MIILSEMMEKNEQIGIWQQLKTKGLKVLSKVSNDRQI
jgi:hypothetical protein